MEFFIVILGASSFGLWRSNLPIMTAPVVFSLWAVVWLGSFDAYETEEVVSIFFGLMVVFIAYAVDWLVRDKDFAFWPYLCGTMSFWFGLTAQMSDDGNLGFLYLIINIGMLFLALYLRRAVFLVFGALGVIATLIQTATGIFGDDMAAFLAFFIISAVGTALGIAHRAQLLSFWSKFVKTMPTEMKRLRPAKRKHFLAD